MEARWLAFLDFTPGKVAIQDAAGDYDPVIPGIFQIT
jgi:hypothetical protein